MRQVEARNRRFGRKLHRPVRIETLLDDAPAPARDRVRMLRDARDDPIAAARAVEVTVRERAVELQPAIRGGHPSRCAPESPRCPRNALTARSTTFSTAPDQRSLASRDEPHAKTIAVHDATHFWRRDEDAVFQTFHAEESVAGAVGADGAFDGAAGSCAFICCRCVPAWPPRSVAPCRDLRAAGARLAVGPSRATAPLRAAGRDTRAARSGHRSAGPSPRAGAACPRARPPRAPFSQARRPSGPCARTSFCAHSI